MPINNFLAVSEIHAEKSSGSKKAHQCCLTGQPAAGLGSHTGTCMRHIDKQAESLALLSQLRLTLLRSLLGLELVGRMLACDDSMTRVPPFEVGMVV